LVQRGVAFVLLVQTEGELEVRNHLGHVVLRFVLDELQVRFEDVLFVLNLQITPE